MRLCHQPDLCGEALLHHREVESDPVRCEERSSGLVSCPQDLGGFQVADRSI